MWFLLAACTPSSPSSVVEPPVTPPAPQPAPTEMPVPTDPPEPPGPSTDVVDRAGYEADVRLLAVPRTPNSPGWQAAQDLCADRFAELGYEVTLDTFATGTNVLGRKVGGEGTVVVGAHYDSVAGCDGADDNASGVAGVLELARMLQDAELDHDVLFACWDQEEAGLVGSTAWVRDHTEVVLEAWSLEMIGYASSAPNTQTLPFGIDLLFPNQAAAVAANDNRGDFIAFVADVPMQGSATDFQAHAHAIGLPVVPLLLNRNLVDSPFTGDLKRSDHAPFWAAGIPAVMLTDSANFRNQAYHCVGAPDTVDRLDFEFAGDVLQAAADTLRQ